ncbi:MAG: hypothetical protein HQL52_10415 [Magnetococcales bacterium]|nr:hypothetical protein [Magnetococcales bacterium]
MESNPKTTSGCGCSSQSRDEQRPCPTCNHLGEAITPKTPQHTLKAPFRKEVDANGAYYFCPQPDCPTVYFEFPTGHTFTTPQLIHRVTVKDEHLETPLCYCFKIKKGEVLDKFRIYGITDISAMIREKAKGRPCQCSIFNPRGVCCTEGIREWLIKEGIDPKMALADGCCSGEDGESCC